MDNQNPQTPDKKSNLIYFLIVVVLALLGTSIYLYFQKNKSDEKLVYQVDTDSKQLISVQTTMKASLDSLTTQLDSANSGKHRVSQELQAKDEELKTKISQLKKALANGHLTAKELRSAQEDIKQLRYFVTKYTADIEELKQQNASLTTERDTLKTNLATVNQKATTLQKQNQDLSSKVQIAAAIKTSSVEIVAYKVKNSGREVEVSRANPAKKIKVNFTVNTNDLAEKGLHDIYLRVIDPTGNLVTSGTSGNFNINSQDMQYTYKSAIDFKNDGSGYVIDWVNPTEFLKGTYSVLLYADGYQMGKSSFNLR
jgi:predicted RNase H-like nuclease (RuvC/YqgF family)